MKILHILSQKPAFTGSGTFFGALVQQIVKTDNLPFLIYSVSAADDEFLFEELEENTSRVEFDCKDIPYPIPGMSDIMPYPSRLFSELSEGELTIYFNTFRSVIGRAILEFKPDVIWTHHLWIASSIVKELSGNTPVIAFCHGSDLLQSKKAPQIFGGIKENLEKIEVIISTSPQQSSEILRVLNHPKILYLGNGIRSDIFRFKKGIYRSDNFIKLSYAGKISKEKGVHCLITSVKMLVDEGMKVELSLFGSSPGKEFKYIKSLAKGYEKSIKFKGNVTQRELGDYLNNSDIFILPSFYEGLGLVVLEAIACGCNVITTDLSNLLSILPDSLFKLQAISKVSLPDIHANIEVEELVSFCLELKESIKEQAGIVKQVMRSEIASCVTEFGYEFLAERLISISRSLVANGV